MRPPFEEIKDGEAFNQWYWLKSELVDICKQAKLPYTGSKFEIRDRIVHFLDTGKTLSPKKKAKQSNFNWAKATLHEETVITDNVSFGPNFRKFMKTAIGSHFTCTGEFMKWVKENPGKTLKHAIQHWDMLEARKEDPDFRSEIAEHNMYNQYLRDYMDHNPEAKLEEAKRSWQLDRQLPAKGGFVRYDHKRKKR